MSEDLKLEQTIKTISFEKYITEICMTKEEFWKQSKMQADEFRRGIDDSVHSLRVSFRWLIGIGITLLIAVFGDILNVAQYFHH